jgi:hypothetical protein
LTEAAANQAFADYLATWPSGLADLRETASNPALKALIGQVTSSYGDLATTIHNRSYAPKNFNYMRTLAASERAIVAACKELVG